MHHLRHSRAFVTIEVLVISLVAMLAVAKVGPFAPGSPHTGSGTTGTELAGEAERDAWRLRFAAEVQLADTGRCPTTTSMLTAGEIRAERDPWNKPYWVLCQDHAVTVVSDGPDGAPFTSDDVGSREVPWARRTASTRRAPPHGGRRLR